MAGRIPLTIVGRARTPYARREDAPHQPVASPEVVSTIEIEPEYRKALADLATFDRVWVIFVFDRSEGWTPRVKPPRGGPKRGVFATRAPHRPSPIGLTNAELVSVDEESGVLTLRGLDLLDETPVLDLKPYIRSIDSWPQASQGWLEPYLQAGIEPKLKKPRRR
jgi:tRNA-Thr(GGU) m(6)t(6)A37 methyltransferase TsaA